MNLTICDTAQQAEASVAQRIRAAITGDPVCLGLATGGTMIPVYDMICAEPDIDFGRVTTFNLDEYVGVPADHYASYHHYMHTHLISRLAQPPAAVHLPRGDADDPDAEARRYDRLIQASGGIALQVLGIGGNGHIGFNEPGSRWETGTRVVALSEATRHANARFMKPGDAAPTHAITMGIATIMAARSCVLLATGASKAPAIARLASGRRDIQCPATALLDHSDLSVVVDADAAAMIA